MTDQELVTKWNPVLEKVRTAKFSWVTRPWLPEKMAFVAKACEDAHKKIEYESRFVSSTTFGEKPENANEKFTTYINNQIRIWDTEMDPSNDIELQRNGIINEIFAELDYTNDKWGDEFDNENTLNDWVTYICMYATDAAKMTTPPTEQRKKLLKAAGLAVSSLISLDRNGSFRPRHYEDGVAKD